MAYKGSTPFVSDDETPVVASESLSGGPVSNPPIDRDLSALQVQPDPNQQPGAFVENDYEGDGSEAPAVGHQMFRSILAGAMMGMLHAGINSNNPAMRAFSGGAMGVEARKEQDRRHAQEDKDQAQQDQKFELDKQRTQAEIGMYNANAAKALADKLHMEAAITQLPEEAQAKYAETFAKMAEAYKRAGYDVLEEVDDTPENRTAYLQKMQKEGTALGDIHFTPAPDKGKIMVVQADDSKMISGEDVASIGQAAGLKLPNHPMNGRTLDALVSAQLRANATRDAAHIRADHPSGNGGGSTTPKPPNGSTNSQLAAPEGKRNEAFKTLQKAQADQHKLTWLASKEQKDAAAAAVAEAKKNYDQASAEVNRVSGELNNPNTMHASAGASTANLSPQAKSIVSKYVH